MRAFEPTRSLIVAFSAALASALLCSGCFLETEQTAGVDDFPNSIYARVDGFLDENKKAEGLEAATATDGLPIRPSLGGPPLPKVPATVALPPLAKRSAGAASAGCDGYLIHTTTKEPVDTRISVDSLFICVDSLAKDPIPGNEHIVRGKTVTRDTVTGRLEISEVTDADGDGFLNPAPAGNSKVRLLLLVTDDGVTERTEIVVGYGADNNLATEPDNLIHLLTWSRTRGTDTLGAASYTDADSDSDGVAIDNSRPSLVDVHWYAQGPTEDDKTAKWSRFQMRTWVVYGVKQTRPVRFSAESESGDGRINSAALLALDGDETFDLADTVLARFQAVGTAPADTVDTMRTTIRMKVGDFDDKTDDTTYALHVEVRKKLGEEVRAVFDFESDRPIPHGREPESGTLAMRVEYADGTFLDVAGKIADKAVDITATLRDGRRFHAVWDAAGRRTSLEHLD